MLLKKGSTSTYVKTLQLSLQKLGFDIQVTGIYDEQTEKTIFLYQEDRDLSKDGVTGNITWNSIIKDLKNLDLRYKEKYTFVSPLDLKCAIVNKASKDIVKKYKNFVNANFWGTKGTIGWMIDNGKVLSRRDEYLQWRGNKKATFIVFNDGRVLIKSLLDSEIVEMLKKNNIKFMVQGHLNSKEEGFDVKEVCRPCIRPIIGYNNETKKVLILCLNGSAEQAKIVANKYGCKDSYILLDAGGSTNFYLDSVGKYVTSRVLNNIIHW